MTSHVSSKRRFHAYNFQNGGTLCGTRLTKKTITAPLDHITCQHCQRILSELGAQAPCEEDEHATQTIGESLYWWAVERAGGDPATAIEQAIVDGSGTFVTTDARQYARELLAEGLGR